MTLIVVCAVAIIARVVYQGWVFKISAEHDFSDVCGSNSIYMPHMYWVVVEKASPLTKKVGFVSCSGMGVNVWRGVFRIVRVFLVFCLQETTIDWLGWGVLACVCTLPLAGIGVNIACRSSGGGG